jgi:hypothetical protein
VVLAQIQHRIEVVFNDLLNIFSNSAILIFGTISFTLLYSHWFIKLCEQVGSLEAVLRKMEVTRHCLYKLYV